MISRSEDFELQMSNMKRSIAELNMKNEELIIENSILKGKSTEEDMSQDKVFDALREMEFRLAETRSNLAREQQKLEVMNKYPFSISKSHFRCMH